jgi:hypothetical protein
LISLARPDFSLSLRLTHESELLDLAGSYDNRIVYACGFTREDTIRITVLSDHEETQQRTLSTEDLNGYNRWTGEITVPDTATLSRRLYGIGIAFPQCYRHEDGSVELWLGFRRSMKQIESILRELSTE